jgi:hypothetical protein
MRFNRTVGIGAAVLALTHTSSAYAYLDPGTASILVQGLIAAVVGALLGVKFYWAQLKAVLFRRKKPTTEPPAKPQDPT